MNSNPTPKRRYEIDWLRNLGILLLFPFHSARVFDYWDPFYVKNEVASSGLSWFIAVTSYWFMPLLFWLAGSASWYALTVRSGQEYIKDRLNRLFIPLLAGLLLIVPPQGYYARKLHSGETGSYLDFLPQFFTDFSDLSGYFGTFTPAHLWFILYLFVLSLVALPLFTYLKRDSMQKPLDRLAKILSRPFVFILLFIPLMATLALPAPGGQNPVYFLFIFAVGFLVCSNQHYQDMFNRIKFKALLAEVVLVPIWLVLITHYPNVPSFSPMDILITAIRTLNVWLTLIVILGYGNQFLNFRHKLLPYLNEAAFPVYIVHQSVLVIVGFYIIQFELGILPKFLLVMALTFLLSFAMYELVIRRTAFTRFLFGVKPAKSAPTARPPKPPSSASVL